ELNSISVTVRSTIRASTFFTSLPPEVINKSCSTISSIAFSTAAASAGSIGLSIEEVDFLPSSFSKINSNLFIVPLLFRVVFTSSFIPHQLMMCRHDQSHVAVVLAIVLLLYRLHITGQHLHPRQRY